MAVVDTRNESFFSLAIILISSAGDYDLVDMEYSRHGHLQVWKLHIRKKRKKIY